ncbi:MULTISPECIES: hypothetical protein [unclassified Arthrobacter]|uniref:hypothetical protein n=1 Tax=unclassified Arthrobacter TaxID=235627 RepID=UPI001965C891|nr:MULTISPECIES: hypothetical protein [unclassified Arthrobacter]
MTSDIRRGFGSCDPQVLPGALEDVSGQWQEGPTYQGRPRAPDLLDVLDIFLATGARIGEVLAIRWKDVDLRVEPSTITISGTVVMEKGRGDYRQDHPKTRAGFRTMKVPPFAYKHSSAGT